MSNNVSKEQFNLLVDKGILHKGGFIQLFSDIGADYKILDILNENEYKFNVYNIDTRKSKIVPQSDIQIIEDMAIDRIMEAYLVDEELNTHDIIKKTDVAKTVIGKKNASISGIELEDGMKLVLHNDKTTNYNNKILTVSGVGSSIKLSAPRGRPRKNQ